jgi:hypothetical protein
MQRIRFSEIDAWILYCIPKPIVDLREIVRYYTFVNRAAPPTLRELKECLAKALSVGIIKKQAGGFIIDDVWYDKIHAADGAAENEIESMLAFQESLLGMVFDVSKPVNFVLDRREYDEALRTAS